MVWLFGDGIRTKVSRSKNQSKKRKICRHKQITFIFINFCPLLWSLIFTLVERVGGQRTLFGVPWKITLVHSCDPTSVVFLLIRKLTQQIKFSITSSSREVFLYYNSKITHWLQDTRYDNWNLRRDHKKLVSKVLVRSMKSFHLFSIFDKFL